MDWIRSTYKEYSRYSNILKTIVGIKSFYFILWICVILGLVHVNNLLYTTLETVFLLLLGIYGFYLFNPISARTLDKEDRLIGFTMAGFILWLIDYQHVWEVWTVNYNKLIGKSEDEKEKEEDKDAESKSVIKGKMSQYDPVGLTTGSIHFAANSVKHVLT